MDGTRILYLDCQSGISGDMFVAALLGLGVSIDQLRPAIDSLGLEGLSIEYELVKRGGFAAHQFRVEAPPQHHHRHLPEIERIIRNGKLEPKVVQIAIAIFKRLAQAEARVHGSTMEKIHFHEVGAIDSIVDIVSAAWAIVQLDVDEVVCSEVAVGHGQIDIEHGKVSLPAPATAELLRHIPVCSNGVPFELTTPTGAAAVAELANRFGPMPPMTIEAIGWGAGSRELPQQANVVRAYLGVANPTLPVDFRLHHDRVFVLETNIDHIAGEVMGHCLQQLMAGGALDAFAQPIQMKKDRPATRLTVLCRPADVPRLERTLFEETGTLGIRRWAADRSMLPRREHAVSTAAGEVRGQLIEMPGGTERFSPEYESCLHCSQQTGISLMDVMNMAALSYEASKHGDASPAANAEHSVR